LLCLRLLREAERTKTRRLVHETTTALAAISAMTRPWRLNWPSTAGVK
jgi:hypothetical protein